jgi:hypothetical protein
MSAVLFVVFVFILVLIIVLFTKNKKKNLIILIKSLMKSYVDQIQQSNWKHVESQKFKVPIASVHQYGKKPEYIDLSTSKRAFEAFEVIELDETSPIAAISSKSKRIQNVQAKTPSKAQRKSILFQKTPKSARRRNSWHVALNQTEEDFQNNQIQCRLCNKICKNEHGLQVHLRMHYKKN